MSLAPSSAATRPAGSKKAGREGVLRKLVDAVAVLLALGQRLSLRGVDGNLERHLGAEDERALVDHAGREPLREPET